MFRQQEQLIAAVPVSEDEAGQTQRGQSFMLMWRPLVVPTFSAAVVI